MPKGVAVNVGVNTKPKYGHCRGPIFHDGDFEFIHIPWNVDEYGMVDPTPKRYSDMPPRYSSYVREELKNKYVARSPDFDNYCFASSAGATANSLICELGPSDYLFFYATLDFRGNLEMKETWINPEWGAYVVGLFKIFKIWKRSDILSDEEANRAFQDYDFYKLLKRPECFGAYNSEEAECQQCTEAQCCSQSQGVFLTPNTSAPWVKGIGEENGKKASGLINPTIPLSRPERGNSRKWSPIALELFVTPTRKPLSENAGFRTALRCESECLERLLAMCVLRNNDEARALSKTGLTSEKG